MESEVIRPGVKQTFTWSTPFFDVTFVDIKTRKDRGGNRRSSSRKREVRHRRELSLGSTSTATPRGDPRSRRRLPRHASSSDSDDEHLVGTRGSSDKLSYTEFKRRRKQKESARLLSGSGQDLSRHRSKLSSQSLRSSESLPRLRHSPEHIYQSIGSDLGLSKHDKDDSKPISDKNIDKIKIDNHDSGRSISPPHRRFLSREGSVESSGQTSGISLQFRSGSLRSLSRESRDRDSLESVNCRPAVRRRSFLLNTSYSSEELGGPTGLESRLTSTSRSIRLPPSISGSQDRHSSSPPTERDNGHIVRQPPPVSPIRPLRSSSSFRAPANTDTSSAITNRISQEELCEGNSRPRRLSDLILPPSASKTSLSLNLNNSQSPGSVLSPQTPGSGSSSKPPIFSSPDVKSTAFKFVQQRQKSEGTLVGSSDNSNTQVTKDPEKVKRRRSFNPNESAPPRPSQLSTGRPHSVYRMEHQNNNNKGDTDNFTDTRRRSDFLSRYEELTCRAAAAIKSVDKIVENERNSQIIHDVIPIPPAQHPLESPITPDVESVEFNEEEVLKTCQDFLNDYDRSKTGQSGVRSIPVPAPRLSLTSRVDFPSSRHQSSAVSAVPSLLTSQLSKEDEELLEAAQEKSFWDPKPSDATSVFDRIDNKVFDSKIIRTRSSSLTIHDKNDEKIKPILKKSTEDLAESTKFPSILKTRDDFGLYPSKSKHEGKYEHVRIRSPSFDKNDHVRIRSPSPEFDQEILDFDEIDGARCSSPDSHSSMKNRFRRRSVDGISFDDDLDDGEPQSILKRKSSFGSGCHSPEGNTEITRSILKKSSRNSSRTCSRSGSIEELDIESTKSILKSRNSSRTCSRSGSQEELDLDFDDDWESRPKSILKKKSWSTDDELDERPKSILKSRRSEESLSPNSDQVETPSHSILREGRSSSGTRQSSIISDNEDILVISGRNSPSLRISTESPLIIDESPAPRRPILKHRDDNSAPHGILKKRERSVSPEHDVSQASFRNRDLSCPEQRHLSSPSYSRRPLSRFLTQPFMTDDVIRDSNIVVNQESVAASLPVSQENISQQSLPSLPPQPSLATRPRPSRRKHNSPRFQTQPITIDEVEMASARNRRDGSLTPPLRPNQFLYSFSNDHNSVLLQQRRQLQQYSDSLTSSLVTSSSTTTFKPVPLPRSDTSEQFRISPSRQAASSSSDNISVRTTFLRSNSSPPPPRQSSPLPFRTPFTATPHPPPRSVSSPPPSAHQDTEQPPPGPIPLSSPTLPKSRASLETQFSSDEIPGPSILKNSSETAQSLPALDDIKVPPKSILKQDNGPVKTTSSEQSSLNYQLPDGDSSSSSTEDLAQNFSDVIIDPVPGQGRRSAPETPSKRLTGRSSLGSGTVTGGGSLAPQSLNISADGDLASKLAMLAGQADNIKHKMTDNKNSRSNVFQKSSSVDCESMNTQNRSHFFGSPRSSRRTPGTYSPNLLRRPSHGSRNRNNH